MLRFFTRSGEEFIIKGIPNIIKLLLLEPYWF